MVSAHMITEYSFSFSPVDPIYFPAELLAKSASGGVLASRASGGKT